MGGKKRKGQNKKSAKRNADIRNYFPAEKGEAADEELQKLSLDRNEELESEQSAGEICAELLNRLIENVTSEQGWKPFNGCNSWNEDEEGEWLSYEKPRLRKRSSAKVSSSQDDDEEPSSSGTKRWNKPQDDTNIDLWDPVSRPVQIDKEFENFHLSIRTKKIDFRHVTEVQEDLFMVPKTYALAHCVAEDLSMGSGIAVQFKREFKRVDELRAQKQKQGGLAVLDVEGRFVYYLVTKKVSSGKPILYTLWQSLWKMQRHVQEHNVGKLAMPRIACGLDSLEWTTVKPMIEYVFSSTDVEIKVCNFQQNYGKTKQKLQTKAGPKDTRAESKREKGQKKAKGKKKAKH